MAPRMDATLQRELHLPLNVQMILTPLAGALNLDQLVQLVDYLSPYFL